ncbi:Polyphenol oxidase, chloroplastic [Dichanthelium oligosanthes]|uniref:Polyphenol oxidase, chloroplastic n=1 Tax=Dichanthelium oligosanthes TaxID=888268 RepID=A0A1E5VN09_9POAL|nr:Polyphenol oxidase, chloroplastic [Dichanthelium oligosanthes]
MASLSQLIARPAIFSPSSPRTSSGVRPRRATVQRVLCASSRGERPEPDHATKHDRRDVLLGLSALGASASATLIPARRAGADPVATPDISTCGPADLPPSANVLTCCPPPSNALPVAFDTPDAASSPLRTRPAAHSVTADYVAKFNAGIAAMKALPAGDPRSFAAQASVHCAYCDGSYSPDGFPGMELQVHNSWLFFPFHRCYLYFFERILGSLIGDPTFGIPFWNWDAPDGMRMPAMYTDQSSQLFDPRRDGRHAPPKLIDLDYNGRESRFTDSQQIDHNLRVMYRQMVSLSPTPSLFFGSAYRAGDDPNQGPGAVENIPHGPVHIWSGDPNQPASEDMGNFYSAGNDPLFYAHHANIDRMWSVWKGLDARRHTDITDPDWLDASFLFYDETPKLVRIRVRDVLDTDRLRYRYQDVPLPWRTARPTLTAAATQRADSLVAPAAQAAGGGATKAGRFPITLDEATSVTVRRPVGAKRSKAEKASKEEVLVIDGVEVDRDVAAKFDVFVNTEDHSAVGSGGRELAGSFVNVPHGHGHAHGNGNGKKGRGIRTTLRLALNEQLEDLKAEGDESVEVTLVPRQGKGKVKIGGVRIELMH